MISLARFILKGHSQAALVAVSTGMMVFLFPPFGLLSGASVALITLVGGIRNGFVVTMIAAIGLAAIMALVLPAKELAVYLAVLFVLLIWLPAILAAEVLRRTVSLVFCLQLIAAVCLAGIVLQYQLFPEFGSIWHEALNSLADQMVAQFDGELDRAQLQGEIDRLSQPGVLAKQFMIGILLSLYIARWWQAVIYNPGGFGSEFRSINLGHVTALLAVVIVLLAAITGSAMLQAMLLVTVVLYLNQGIAILHTLYIEKKFNTMWLIPMYVLIFFVQPVQILLALVGLADTWIDFRRRLIA